MVKLSSVEFDLLRVSEEVSSNSERQFSREEVTLNEVGSYVMFVYLVCLVFRTGQSSAIF